MALAKRLRPDRMLLAVKEDGRHLMVQLQAAKEALAAEGIKFELLTPMEYSTNGDPLLRAEA